MKVRKVLNGKYLFVNNFTSNRYGFNHISTLFLGEREVGKASCHYINRTWEYYDYQTSMRAVISNLIEKMQNRAIADYKTENNITRLVKAKKENVLAELENDEQMKEYRQIYKELESWA